MDLANTCFAQGRLAEAEELQVQVLAASTRVRGEDHPETLRVAENLARTQQQQQQQPHAGERGATPTSSTPEGPPPDQGITSASSTAPAGSTIT